MSLLTPIARAGAVVAAAASLTLAVAAAPAEAATGMTVELTIRKQTNNNTCWVGTEGVIPMSQYDAEGFIVNGSRVELRIYGDDPSSDNLQYGPYLAEQYAGPNGLNIRKHLQLPCGYLNEDRSWYEGDGDEIFVNARFVDGDGGVRTANSAVVRGVF